MIKSVIILIALIVALTLTGVAFTQEKAKPAEAVKAAKPEKPAEPAQPAEVAKPAKAAKKKAPKIAEFRAGGLVTALDIPGMKITIKQDQVKRERKLILSVSKKAAKDLTGVKVGDEVNVWVTGKTVTALKRVY